MTFTYYWKTPDNARHTGEIEADDREKAFALLRARGIRAIKVEPKGWETGKGYRGVRRRTVAASVLAAVALGAGAAWWLGGRVGEEQGPEDAPYRVMTPQGPVTYTVAVPLPRQAIPGDRTKIEAAMNGRDARSPNGVFRHAAEAYLVRFAEPGRRVEGVAAPAHADFVACLRDPVHIASTDFTEVVDLKRIVAGMKREMRAYLAGGGTVEGYLAELEKRQRLEISYRERAERRLAAMLSQEAVNSGNGAVNSQLSSAYSYWLKANAQLKAMGIYELPLPDVLRSYQMSMELDE